MKLAIFFYLLLILQSTNNHSVSKRALLFPRATVLQFTYGLSVPAILPARTIILTLGFQVNYDLPYNLTRLLQPTVVQAKENDEFDLSRETFYSYAIHFLNSFGFDGEDCLLRLICELSEYPLHLDHQENLLEKIVHYIFTPSLEIFSNSTDFGKKLIEAETLGSKEGNCDATYSKCLVSLVSLFTSKYIF